MRIINKTAKRLWEITPGKFIGEVTLNDTHQAKCDYLQISLGLTKSKWKPIYFSRQKNERRYISPVKKDRTFIVHFKIIRCQRLAPDITHSTSPVAYPGGCIACACTPGGLRGAPKRRGEKERSKERERKKGKEKGRQRRREGKGKKICKRKGKEGRNQKKIGYKKKNTRVATREWQ